MVALETTKVKPTSGGPISFLEFPAEELRGRGKYGGLPRRRGLSAAGRPLERQQECGRVHLPLARVSQ